MKLINSSILKILLYVIFIVLIINHFLCVTFANAYSNNGIEFTVYDNENVYNSDDMNMIMCVTVKVKNKNRYADADVDIVANENNTFSIVSNKNQSINIAPMEETELRFAYLYKGFHILDLRNKKNEIHIKADLGEEKIYDYETYLKMLIDKGSGIVATESIIKELNNMTEKIEENNNKSKTKFPIWLIAVIVIIVAIILLIVLYRIYKEYKATYFSIFAIFLAGILIVALNIRSVNAYGVETFIYGKRYSNTYQGRVYFSDLIHNMSYTVSYKYNGDNPYKNNLGDFDNDGLLNSEEVYFMTDINGIDTDGDGLSDYEEVYRLNLSPIDIDTDGNGVKDGDEDFDVDGLSNISEIQGMDVEGVRYYSNPTEEDTDGDGINDYDEIKGNNIYNFVSDPSNIDTDGDSISDYEEISLNINFNLEIDNEDGDKIALNPRNVRSNGVWLDRERKFEQVLSNSMIESSLYKDNVIIPKISGVLSGIIDEHISIKEERGIENDETILGKVLNISSDYNEYITVGFEVKKYIDKIEYLKIALYKNGKVTILDTEIEGDEIKSKVISGVVFVVDTTKLVDKIISFRKDNWK